jgi:hypothetical protein
VYKVYYRPIFGRFSFSVDARNNWTKRWEEKYSIYDGAIVKEMGGIISSRSI